MRALLAPLPMPVHVLPAATTTTAPRMRAAFPLDGDGEYRYVARGRRRAAGRLRLDVPRRPEGRLDVAWLEAQLDAPRVVVAMHHPPFGVGHAGARRDRARRATTAPALAALLRRSPQVLRVLCGHTHRAAFAVARRLRRVHRAGRAPDRAAGDRRAGLRGRRRAAGVRAARPRRRLGHHARPADRAVMAPARRARRWRWPCGGCGGAGRAAARRDADARPDATATATPAATPRPARRLRAPALPRRRCRTAARERADRLRRAGRPRRRRRPARRRHRPRAA